MRPRPYFPTGHVAVHASSVIAGCAFAAGRLVHVTLLEAITVPVWLFLGSAFVYWFHRYVLHRPTRLFYFAYEKHTLQHHRFFDYEHITRDERDDLHAMLFPWWSGLPLLALSYGVSLGLTPVLGENVALLSMFMMNGYFGLYELVHTVSHLPDEHVLARLPVLSFLREHHRLHHEPALMGKHNFNVVIPLFDWWFGALIRQRPKQTRPTTRNA